MYIKKEICLTTWIGFQGGIGLTKCIAYEKAGREDQHQRPDQNPPPGK